jgi:hypothetical protein
VKLFKQLTLVLSSLLVVGFSFSSNKSFDSSTSLQKKSIDCHFAALADDDIDDDLTDPEFQLIYTCNSDVINQELNLIEDIQYASVSYNSSLPHYLKVRNLRI